MRIVDRLKELELLTGNKECNYEVSYVYDDKQRISEEKITGDIVKDTIFTYDSQDNISTEVVTLNGKTLTKNYVYDQATNNLTSVKITVS
ncbi:hypothetical protein [Clostridium felsineum]|uniref:hypothetical protein n=1 Tax=Clostridium felsineum TaxID=36839 RepID=UPI00098CAC71|nr:hypothetical protein [Clostridium felsineum]URZ18515.1 hypothetical protein CLFE_046030 [Clostridium felsineum DSM 794]